MAERNSGGIEYVANRGRILQLVPTISTSPAHSANDVVIPVTEIKAINPVDGVDSNQNGTWAAFPSNGCCLLLEDLTLVDQEGQEAALDLFFFKSAVLSFNAVNVAEGLSDTDSTELLGHLDINSYHTMANLSIASLQNIGMILQAEYDSDQLWVAASTTGTPTYGAADDLRLTIKCREL